MSGYNSPSSTDTEFYGWLALIIWGDCTNFNVTTNPMCKTVHRGDGHKFRFTKPLNSTVVIDMQGLCRSESKEIDVRRNGLQHFVLNRTAQLFGRSCADKLMQKSNFNYCRQQEAMTQ